jgi:hypothetical protein
MLSTSVRIGALVLSLNLAACGREPPGTMTRMPVQGEAFALVRERFGALFPPEVLIEPEVRWWTDLCPGTERTAVRIGSRCYAGLYYRDEGVDVAWRGSIGESAYSHELMHYFLDKSGAGSDPLHQRPGCWQLVEQTDLLLQTLRF